MNESKKPYASVGGTELSLWDITKILLAKIHWLLLAGVVVAGISSPGVFRRNATAGLPVNGIYPLIPIQ